MDIKHKIVIRTLNVIHFMCMNRENCANCLSSFVDESVANIAMLQKCDSVCKTKKHNKYSQIHITI